MEVFKRILIDYVVNKLDIFCKNTRTHDQKRLDMINTRVKLVTKFIQTKF